MNDDRRTDHEPSMGTEPPGGDEMRQMLAGMRQQVVGGCATSPARPPNTVESASSWR